MSDDATVQETEPVEVEETTDDLDSLTALNKAELAKEIKKLRQENAARRVKFKETEEAAQQWQKHVDSQKSALEKLNEDYKKLQEEHKTSQLQVLQQRIATEMKLDPELAEFVTGSTEAEMRKKAEKLVEKYPSGVSGPSQLMPGRRGEPVVPRNPDAAQEFFSYVWHNADR